MAIRRYSPPLERIKEEYARQVREKVMARRRPPRPLNPAHPIPDNSTPWLEQPRTVGDFLFIARCVQDLVEQWGPRPR